MHESNMKNFPAYSTGETLATRLSKIGLLEINDSLNCSTVFFGKRLNGSRLKI